MICAIEESAPGCIRPPFVILIDNQEKAPWSFAGITARSFIDKEQREYLPVRTERRYLGIGMGDYSLAGYEGRIAIERKSLEDFHGTLLGWEQKIDGRNALAEWDTRNAVHRRKRFKNELARLARMEMKAVIVEAELSTVLQCAPSWGVRSSSENSKYLFATFMAWSQEFPVPWIFAPDREAAAVFAFRLLEKFWHLKQKERNREE